MFVEILIMECNNYSSITTESIRASAYRIKNGHIRRFSVLSDSGIGAYGCSKWDGYTGLRPEGLELPGV